MVLLTLIQCLVELLACSFIFTILGMIVIRLAFERINARCHCASRLDGKTVLVTGGSSGIGLETARDLAGRGARVILTCLREETARSAAAEIIASTGNKNVHHKQLDLASFDNIQRFANDINDSFEQLHILVNNAGVNINGNMVTENGIEMSMQVNYIGTAFLTLLLLPKLKKSMPSRIVVVSSKASKTAGFSVKHLKGDDSLSLWQRYSSSKLNMLLWTKALSRRLPEGVTANALHPGIVKTNIYVNKKHFLTNGLFIFLVGKLFKTAEEGAQTSIHCCVSRKLEGVSGQYLAECQVEKAVAALDDYDSTEKAWNAAYSFFESRLSEEQRI